MYFFQCMTQELFLKGTVHLKMKILSFTHPQVVPNLYECVCSEHKGRYSEEWGKQQYFSPTMEVNGAPKQPDYKLSSKYLPLCSEQTHSYRFGSTWGRVNDDRIFIFGCTVPLRAVSCLVLYMSSTQADLALEALQIKLDVLVHLPLLVRQMCDRFSNAGDQDLPAGADEFIWGTKLVFFIETSGTVKSRTV